MKKIFKYFGVNDKEMHVYLKLLELGPQPVSVLARHLHTPRSSMYLILEELKKLKLVTEFKRANVLFFCAASVDEIKELFRKKEEELVEIKQYFETVEEELREKEQMKVITPKVDYFEGVERVKKLYKIIAEEPAFVGFFNPEKFAEVLATNYLNVADISKNNNTHVREILVDSDIAQEYKTKYSSPLHHIRILPSEQRFNADIIITGDNMYMVTFDQNDVAGIEINNPILAQAMRIAFEGWWNAITFE